MRKVKLGMRAIAGSVCVFLALQPVVAQKLSATIQWEHYTIAFDGSLNNVEPLALGRVEGGKFVYWLPNAVR
jgi:hypothetical protein